MTEAVLSPDGLLRFRGQTFRAAIGEAGISTTKHEGDHTTPAGLLPLRRVYYRADRIAKPRAAVPVEPLAPDDGWCDDPADRFYNRAVTLPHPGSHEELWRGDAVYDVIGVLGWNDDPIEPRRGSAIFLHVATPDLAPTAGCIALALPDVIALIGDGLSAIRVVE